MSILVTGATGFVGSHLVRELVAQGRPVHALVRDAAKAERVLGRLGLPPSAWTVGDMTDAEIVARALEGREAVVHAAAAVSVTSQGQGFAANLAGTRVVVGLACERGLETLFVSSMTAIFDPKRPMNDDSPLVHSRTRYGRSKAESDRFVRDLQEGGAPVGIVYPSGVVGPGDPGWSESVKAYRSFLRGTLASEGGNQMVDVRDLAVLFMRMVEARTRGRVCAAGHFHDWDEFTALLENVTGARIPRVRAPGWALRGAARAMDAIGGWTGRRMPMTFEGIEIATRMRPMRDSPRIAELGVAWRPPEQTLRDLYRWYVEVGRLPASAVPALATSDAPASPREVAGGSAAPTSGR